ncbi:hypothetical protein SEA_LIGMA_67 [Gordonia phage Ligma]|nr:hypothetical protein SEA_LIGMA_67 [Gordonia phage Ligma]UQT02166.1 hypothetical protein SEA_AXUMITE_67 [Gordonia phage Axumite]
MAERYDCCCAPPSSIWEQEVQEMVRREADRVNHARELEAVSFISRAAVERACDLTASPESRARAVRIAELATQVEAHLLGLD